MRPRRCSWRVAIRRTPARDAHAAGARRRSAAGADRAGARRSDAGPARVERARSAPRAVADRHDRAHDGRRVRARAGAAAGRRRWSGGDACVARSSDATPVARRRRRSDAARNCSSGYARCRGEGRQPQAGGDREVTAIAYDSRQVEPGAVFVALRGSTPTGREFAPQAIAAARSRSSPRRPRRPAWRCRGSRSPTRALALAELAAAFYGNPSERADARRHHRHQRQDDDDVPAGGGLRSRRHRRAGGSGPSAIASASASATRRTRRPKRPRCSGCCARCWPRAAARARWRSRRTRWRCAASTACGSPPAIFTNLTRDHLDFHGDMEAYFAAKRRLFELLPEGAVGVINVDDRRGARSGRGGAASGHLRDRCRRGRRGPDR